MTTKREIDGRALASRKARGWGRSLLIAILLHVIVGFGLWRVAVRLHVGGFGAPTASASSVDPPRPIILQAMESIHSSQAPAPLAAYEEREPVIEWEVRRHPWVQADWMTENAPLIGYPSALNDLVPTDFKAKTPPPVAQNPDLQR